MYLSFYGLREAPFAPTPDPKFLFQSPRHREALAQLIYGVRERKGFIVLTGEIGTGKTTLLRTLLERLDATTPVAYVHNSALNIEGLLEYILQDWGAKSVAQTHAQRLFELNEFLIDQHKKGSSPVLVIDEAQNLSVPTLEAVRLLSNFETTSQKLMQILLVGQPELRDKLNLPELRQLKQRVGLRCHIAALSPEETRQYIRHRLRIAGATDAGIFSDAAIQKISDYSQGTPRVINIVCDHCLLSGYADSKRRIDAGIVQEAVEYLEEGERREWKTRRSVSLVPSNGALWAARSGVALLVVMIIFLLAFAAHAMGWLAAMPGGTHRRAGGRVPLQAPPRADADADAGHAGPRAHLRRAGARERYHLRAPRLRLADRRRWRWRAGPARRPSRQPARAHEPRGRAVPRGAAGHRDVPPRAGHAHGGHHEPG